ncbi:D-alanyl-D-alanine carboxypeptidase/D-alanyl-D-alanine-endopeptidase [Granulicella cerasi]|uniref:D-alanyl-D-alanine carboxypeptidase/D-alanyl-D-alanine-endopeptidase n=2 Tax=Granulicella cerasi TaxID=741063 RepID=A0ABW1ZBW7_9BACT
MYPVRMFSMRRLPAFALLAFTVGTAAAKAQSPIAAQIDALLNDPRAESAHIGVAVTKLDGTPVYMHDAGKHFRPASVTKLYTSATAFALLGPEKRFSTKIMAYGPIDAEGTLHGKLMLIGGGDANFAGREPIPYVAPSSLPKGAKPTKGPGLADFDTLVAQVKSHGIRRIDGSIGLDVTRFEDTPYGEGWSVDDLLWGYGAPASALVVHDNMVDVLITDPAPGDAGPRRADVAVDPQVPYFVVDASLLNVGPTYPSNQVFVTRGDQPGKLRVSGVLNGKLGMDHEHLAIEQPNAYAMSAFRQAMQQGGFGPQNSTELSALPETQEASFSAEVRKVLPLPATCPAEPHVAPAAASQPTPQTMVAELRSPTLAEDAVYTLKESQNLHAEMMLRNTGVEKTCDPSLKRALQVERSFLVNTAGLKSDDFMFYDGSGMSAKDLVTPRSTVALLLFARQQAWFPQWKMALPIAGFDGTLGSRFKSSAAKGHVFAKTGTLGESRGLAGYIEMPGKDPLAFAIFTEDHTPGSSGDREVMDAIVEAIAAQ